MDPCIPTPQLTPVLTLPGSAENMKLLFDLTMRATMADQAEHLGNNRAWEALKLRVANNTASFDHLVNMMAASASQIGSTEGQAQVTPIRTGTGDTVAASAYPANRAIDVGAAGISTANEAVAAAIAKSVNDTITTELSTLQQTIQALADSQAAIAALLAKLGAGSTPTAGS